MRSYRIGSDVQAAMLGRREIARARRQGRADGRHAITVPARNSGPGGTPVTEDAWTPFIEAAHARARATSDQMVAWLLDQHADLVATIYTKAETVVREHDVDKHLTAGARGRFVTSLSTWRAAAATARARAEAAVDHANQVIHHYWQTFLVAYTRRWRDRQPVLPSPAGWRPGPATVDPFWDKADPVLLLSYGSATDDQATTQAGRTLRRALEILADCTCPICRP